MRARNTKPGLFQNEQLAELPIEARWLFVGLPMLADREGRLEDRPKRIKMQIFPADSVEVEPLLQGLEKQELIVRYEVEGRAYIWIPTFAKHQKPHHRETASVIPPYVNGADHSLSAASPDLGAAQPSLNPESGILNTSSTKKGAQAPSTPPEFGVFKKVYPKRAGSQPWSKAQRAINARLKAGATWEAIIDGAKRYREWVRLTGKEHTEIVMQAATFCGPELHFSNPWNPPEVKKKRLTMHQAQREGLTKRVGESDNQFLDRVSG